MVDTQDYQADCELQKLSERIDGHLVYSSVVDAVSFVGIVYCLWSLWAFQRSEFKLNYSDKRKLSTFAYSFSESGCCCCLGWAMSYWWSY